VNTPEISDSGRYALWEDADSAAVFVCRRCGDCCNGQGGIVLCSKDSERLATHLGLSLFAFHAQYTEEVRGKRRLVCGGSGSCVFSSGCGCSVHEAKPDVCRAWPFFRGNLTDPSSLAMAKAGCPGIHAAADFAGFAQAGARYLLVRGICLPPNETASPAALLPEQFLWRIAEEDTLPYMGTRTEEVQ